METTLNELTESYSLASATRILTHNEETFAQSDLDAFVDDLARMATAYEDWVFRSRATSVLIGATNGIRNGTTHLRAQELLIGIHRSSIGTEHEESSLICVYGSGSPTI